MVIQYLNSITRKLIPINRKGDKQNTYIMKETKRIIWIGEIFSPFCMQNQVYCLKYTSALSSLFNAHFSILVRVGQNYLRHIFYGWMLAANSYPFPKQANIFLYILVFHRSVQTNNLAFIMLMLVYSCYDIQTRIYTNTQWTVFDCQIHSQGLDGPESY